MATDDEPSASRPHIAAARRVLEELGLLNLYLSTADVKLLCIQRFVRLFAYGASTLILVDLLHQLGIAQTRIGLFMSLTLAGDVAISFVLALFADGAGRRAILALGALLMAGSGLVFALFANYWVLLAAAILGVISPSGNEIGPFRAVEESTIAHLTDSSKRSDVYAWYSLSGTAGTAFGLMLCGWVIHHLHVILGRERVDTYRIIFYGYAVIGLIKAMLVFMLSAAVEADAKPATATMESTGERVPLLQGDRDRAQEEEPAEERYWLPKISRQSVSLVLSLCVLFALDSFASGLAPLSWVTYFFKSRYDLGDGKLGSLFFVTSIIAAASMVVASSLAKRFGNVKTMVFTHLPSAVFLALIPIPSSVQLSMVFLVLRACTQSMDVAPRSAFLAAIILPDERTAIMGLVNVVKTTAQSLGPLITGVLADSNLFWVAFVCAGSLKACYDLGLLALFGNHEREEARQDRGGAHRQEDDSGRSTRL